MDAPRQIWTFVYSVFIYFPKALIIINTSARGTNPGERYSRVGFSEYRQYSIIVCAFMYAGSLYRYIKGGSGEYCTNLLNKSIFLEYKNYSWCAYRG